MTGLPFEQIFRLAWPDLSEEDAIAYRTEYREIYDQTVVPATTLFAGARDALRAVHAAGLLQATVTGKRAADCERILRGLDIEDDIDLYLGGDSVPADRHKPAPISRSSRWPGSVWHPTARSSSETRRPT